MSRLQSLRCIIRDSSSRRLSGVVWLVDYRRMLIYDRTRRPKNRELRLLRERRRQSLAMTAYRGDRRRQSWRQRATARAPSSESGDDGLGVVGSGRAALQVARPDAVLDEPQ